MLLLANTIVAALKAAEWNTERMSGNPCYYCGLPCDTVDHVPPKSAREYLDLKRYPRFLIPACRECNNLLGARSLYTPGERKKFIKRALKKRYGRVLLAPSWTDQEIAELGPCLQSTVRASEALKRLVRRRLAW
jgi:hypothetical protein